MLDGYDSSVDGYASGAGCRRGRSVRTLQRYGDRDQRPAARVHGHGRTGCDNVGETTVTCEFTDDTGGTLTIDDGTTGVQLNIGPGNGDRIYTLAFAENAVDVDVRTFGSAVSVTADPPLTEDLVASNVLFCQEYDTSGANGAFVIQQDADGQSVLPLLPVDCPLVPAEAAVLNRIGEQVFAAASWFAPQPLIATAAVARGSGGGGTLQRLSDFDLAEMSSASIEAGDGETVTEGETIDASVKVVVSDGSAASGATIRFFAEAGDLLTCSDATTGTSCVEVTGIDGLASVGWTPALGDHTLYALGCGIAVAGEDTPETATDGILGVLQSSNGGICDRDPSVVDGYDSSVDGYANGAGAGADPFEPFNDAEIALNDLPLVFTATVVEACDNTGESTVTCEFTDEAGGTLTIDDGTTEVQLNIGPGNGNRAYTLAFNDNAVDVDVRTYGRSVSVTADPSFDSAEPTSCVEYSVLPGSRHVGRERGLRNPAGREWPVRVAAAGSHLPAAAGGIRASWTGSVHGVLRLLRGSAPQPLIATAAVARGSGGGGTLQRLSDFDLAEMSSASIEAGASQTITEGETIDASVKVEVSDGSAAIRSDDPLLRGSRRRADLLERDDGHELRRGDRGRWSGLRRLDAGTRRSHAVRARLWHFGDGRVHAADGDGRNPGRVTDYERGGLRSRSDRWWTDMTRRWTGTRAGPERVWIRSSRSMIPRSRSTTCRSYSRPRLKRPIR